MKKLLAILILCLAFPAAAQAADPGPIFGTYCDSNYPDRGCETIDASYFWRTETIGVQQTHYEMPDGALYYNRSQCPSTCTARSDVREITYTYSLTGTYNRAEHVRVWVTYLSRTMLPELRNTLGVNIARTPEANVPWCPDRNGDTGEWIPGTGHPLLQADAAKLLELCGEARPAKPAPIEPIAIQPLAKNTACAAVKYKKLVAKVAARGTSCFAGRTAIARYLSKGRAPGFNCIKISIGRAVKASCVELGAGRSTGAQITASWKR